MKQAKEVASKVTDRFEHDRQYPISKASMLVLAALDIDAAGLNGQSHADQIFAAIGISVSSKRQGRSSVPVVEKIGGGSSRNAGGDYDVWQSPADDIDLSAVAQWM